jgi:hypothetical protein
LVEKRELDDPHTSHLMDYIKPLELRSYSNNYCKFLMKLIGHPKAPLAPVAPSGLSPAINDWKLIGFI